MNSPMPVTATEPSTPSRHWSARLNLKFRSTGQRTELAHCEHEGPLRIQRLFHPDQDGKAHCYLLHPPGGVVLGDDLSINVDVDHGAALLTTPSAGRFYDTAGAPEPQTQRVALRVNNGKLEWLPQETILFDGANAHLHTTIELGDEAQLAFWEVLVMGRPASGERFTRGQAMQTLSIDRRGRPLLRDRVVVPAGGRLQHARAGLGDNSTFGTFVVSETLDREVGTDWLRAFNGEDDQGAFTVSARSGLTIARYLGEDAQNCRQGFADLWQRLTTEPAEIPRIWHT